MDFMNAPSKEAWSSADILRDFRAGRTKRELSRIYLLPIREITQIIKKEGDTDERGIAER